MFCLKHERNALQVELELLNFPHDSQTFILNSRVVPLCRRQLLAPVAHWVGLSIMFLHQNSTDVIIGHICPKYKSPVRVRTCRIGLCVNIDRFVWNTRSRGSSPSHCVCLSFFQQVSQGSRLQSWVHIPSNSSQAP